MIHLKSKMLSLYLLLKDYNSIIIWGEMVGKENGGGRGGKGRIPIPTKLSWKIITIKCKHNF